MSTESKVLKTNTYWGKRSGTYSESKPKGCNYPWGFFFQQMQWTTANNGNQGRPTKCTLTNINKKWFK